MAVAFQPDGRHFLGGSIDAMRRWRLADAQEVGKQTGSAVLAISVSRDHRWIVAGTMEGASVWDGEMREQVFVVEGGKIVDAVDVSSDSTRFATGTRVYEASIWSITTGLRLVGPLKHDAEVTGIRFSPDGKHIVTACWEGNWIRIFDSHTGDKLVTIDAAIPSRGIITPLAWSSNGQHIFAACHDEKIKAFDASTGTQLAESQALHDDKNSIRSIALASNGRFIATFVGHSILFLDTSTLACIGPAIEDSKQIWSVAISLDNSHVATGRDDGKIVIRDLSKILPDFYGPFNVSICAFIYSQASSTT